MRFADSDVYKWLEALGWELGARAVRASWRRSADTADRARRRRPGARRLPQLATSRSTSRAERFVNLAWGHELYCAGHLIQAAVAARARHRRRRGCSTSPAASPTTSARRSAPARDEGTPRPPRDRDRAGRALPRDRRARATSTLAGCFVDAARPRTARRRAGFGRPTSRTTRRCARRPRSTATPCARSTSLPASTDVYLETGDAALLDGAAARCGATWSERKTYLTGGHRRAPHATRRSATRTSCRPTAATARPARRSPSLHVELADAAGHRRGALRRPDRAHALQRLPRRPLARRPRLLLRQPAAACATGTATAASTAPAPAVVRVRLLPAERDAAARVPAALPRHAATTAASRSTSTRRGARSGDAAADGRRPTTRGTAGSRSRSPRPARRRGR